MKDFDDWNKQKKNVQDTGKNKWCNERDMWWCRLGLNVGFEQDGKGEDFLRPVLVIKKFGKHVCLIVPLSTTEKRGGFYVPFKDPNGKQGVAIISQVRLIDTKRLIKRSGKISYVDFDVIRNTLKQLLT